ncbi:VOC family protein [Streptomyces sp. NPDC058807]|uniref:VOC family protein n=1 Tax=unclassified Streptomyces TaxID=2593676 RepID=UPI0036B7C086
MAGEPSFFELGVADPERGSAFYGGLFGWTLEPGPAGRGFSIGTGGVPGGLHGGDAGASPYLFFRVDDLDAALVRVRELGGAVDDLGDEGEKDTASVARFGRFALCRDNQGSVFGLHEPPSAD